MNRRLLISVVVGIALVIAGGLYWWKRDASGTTTDASDANGVVQNDSGRKVLYWHDPMVPGHKFDKPGKSPFMDMQLVPQYADEVGAGGVNISSQVAQNLGIRLAKAETMTFSQAPTAVGRIEADEHRLYAVQTRAAGYVERLYVRAVGDPVKAGQKLADVYAPDLLAAQQEFLELSKLGLTDGETLTQAARTRLKLLGMNDSEINAIARSGEAQPRYGVYAPVSGFVLELGVREGAQTMPGTSLMQVGNLDSVWLIAEVPEREAGRIKPGDRVQTKVESLPGETFDGRIALLYPALDRQARTVRVRVALANRAGRLRPGMFATAQLTGQAREALAVPIEAVIATGARNVVVVKDGQAFRPVEVETGAEHDGRVEILKGLAAGETVVASGQFLVDSEASLKGVLARLSATPSADAGAEETSAATPGATVRGKVMELDVAGGRVTLDHEPIAALNWPRMTMGFKVRDPAALKELKVGDIVSFEVNPKPEGSDYVIERITKAGAQ